MRDDLTELLDEFSDVGPGLELRERILADAALYLRARAPATPDRRYRLPRRVGGLLIAAAGIAIVLLVLALAAHSRRQPPGDGTPRSTRIVPDVRGKSVIAAIATLQRAGFRVSVPHGFRFGSLNPWPTAGREHPAAGSRLPAGATVTLTDIRYGCCTGSPVARNKPRAPGLVANTAGEAIHTLRRLHLPWEVHVRAFSHERRPLLTTARVVSQTPAPGILITHGGGIQVPTIIVAYQRNLSAATLTVPQGWQTGASSNAAAPGGQTFTWAGTNQFRDAPFSAPPTRTLKAMRPNDLLIEVFLSRPQGGGGVENTPVLPIKLNASAPSQDYPGSTGTRWFQHFLGNVSGRRTLDVWVFAGRSVPTRAQAVALQRVLNTIRTPQWHAR